MGYEIIYKDSLLSMLSERCILLGYRGSITHDTYEEGVTHDDKDIMGIFIPPECVIFGLDKVETIERRFKEKLSEKRMVEWDVVWYSFQKYLFLLLKQNPNVLSLLWLDERFYLKKTKWGERLIAAREKFLTKQCYESFSGYAYGQLHRMTHIGPTGRLGEKRKELIGKFGYDVKNAAHLIRLLKMGIEILVLGKLIVSRPDNNMLLEIKRGEWPLSRVLEYTDTLFKGLNEALIKSVLPAKVNYDFANTLCVEIMKDFCFQ